MLNKQDFAQSQAKSLGSSTSGEVLAFPRTPTKAEPKINFYQDARNRLHVTILKIEGAYSPSTIRAYRANFQSFINYCEKESLAPLPSNPNTVCRYIACLASGRLKSTSIRIAISAISTIHKLNRFTDPTKDPDVILEARRMHRKLGRASGQALGINYTILDKLIDATDLSLRGARDQALILLAYDSLCRRSELVALRIEDINNLDPNKGLQIRLRKSKTDPNALGKWLFISKRTQVAIENWISISEIVDGYLFRGITRKNGLTKGLSGGQINRIYKRLAAEAMLDREVIEHISGHSMRVGSAQDLLASGASMPMIMNRGRWSKTDTVMRYVENAQLTI